MFAVLSTVVDTAPVDVPEVFDLVVNDVPVVSVDTDPKVFTNVSVLLTPVTTEIAVPFVAAPATVVVPCVCGV